MVNSLDEVIERLQYKADNIKAKLEPSYFTECIDYLKVLNSIEHYSETEELDGYGYGCSNKTCVARVRNRVIYDFAEKLCEYCMKQTNCCNPLECPFCRDGCDVLNIANKMKGE